MIMERYRKAMTSASLPLLPSFASSISALMPQQGMFMISTAVSYTHLKQRQQGIAIYRLQGNQQEQEERQVYQELEIGKMCIRDRNRP